MKTETQFRERHIFFSAEIIRRYTGSEPFHLYLKKYFSEHKKHGSRDRRAISSLCYGNFRLGRGVDAAMAIEDRIVLAQEILHRDAPDKTRDHTAVFDPESVFPFNDDLSALIPRIEFNRSFLIQPLLFIRIRPGHQEKVIHTLNRSGIAYVQSGENTIGLENSIRVHELFRVNREVVIQDMNSQRTNIFFDEMDFSASEALDIWDACAGSGGKSILISDHFPEAKLTVSDVRPSILHNLRQRLQQAGIQNYRSLVTDLTQATDKSEAFHLIIADVPCSGSGTWSRTPEQLMFFRHDQIRVYKERQAAIIKNCLPALRKGGYLLYITCSVFREENEDNVASFCSEHALQIVSQKYLEGFERRADTLYGALMKYE